MLETYNINDIKSGDWLVIKNDDGSLQKDGSFQISWCNKETNKIYGRGYKKKFDYECGFDLGGYTKRVLCSDKEFKKITKKEQNIFSPKDYVSEKLKEMDIEFTKISYRKKVQVSHRRYPVKGDYVPNGYVSKILIEGERPKFNTGSVELREFHSKLENLKKDIQNKTFGYEVTIEFVDSIKDYKDFIL